MMPENRGQINQGMNQQGELAQIVDEWGKFIENYTIFSEKGAKTREAILRIMRMIHAVFNEKINTKSQYDCEFAGAGRQNAAAVMRYVFSRKKTFPFFSDDGKYPSTERKSERPKYDTARAETGFLFFPKLSNTTWGRFATFFHRVASVFNSTIGPYFGDNDTRFELRGNAENNRNYIDECTTKVAEILQKYWNNGQPLSENEEKDILEEFGDLLQNNNDDDVFADSPEDSSVQQQEENGQNSDDDVFADDEGLYAVQNNV